MYIYLAIFVVLYGLYRINFTEHFTDNTTVYIKTTEDKLKQVRQYELGKEQILKAQQKEMEIKRRMLEAQIDEEKLRNIQIEQQLMKRKEETDEYLKNKQKLIEEQLKNKEEDIIRKNEELNKIEDKFKLEERYKLIEAMKLQQAQIEENNRLEIEKKLEIDKIIDEYKRQEKQKIEEQLRKNEELKKIEDKLKLEEQNKLLEAKKLQQAEIEENNRLETEKKLGIDKKIEEYKRLEKEKIEEYKRLEKEKIEEQNRIEKYEIEQNRRSRSEFLNKITEIKPYVEKFNQIKQKIYEYMGPSVSIFNNAKTCGFSYDLVDGSSPLSQGQMFMNSNKTELTLHYADKTGYTGVNIPLSKSTIFIKDGVSKYQIGVNKFNSSPNLKGEFNIEISLSGIPDKFFNRFTTYIINECDDNDLSNNVIMENQLWNSFLVFVALIIIALLIINYKTIIELFNYYYSNKADSDNKIKGGNHIFYVGGYDYRDYSE